MRAKISSFLLALFLLGCGTYFDKSEPTPPPSLPPSPPAGGKCATQWAALKPLLQASCNKCHGSSQPALLPQAVFDRSPVRAKLVSGQMPPPPAKLSPEAKKAFDDYLSCSGK